MSEQNHPATGDSGSIAHAIRAEQLRTIYRHGTKGLGSTLAYVFFLSYLFRDLVPSAQLISWLAFTLLIYSLRLQLVRRFRREGDKLDIDKPWDTYFLIGAVFGGLSWGIFGALFYPVSSPLHLSLIVTIVGGLCAYTIVAYSSVRWASAAFIVPALLPLALRLIAEGGELYWIIGILLLTYTAVLLASAELNYHITDVNMRLAEEQRRLANHYREAREQADELVGKLARENDERRHVEEELRRSEHKLNEIIANLQDTVYRTNLEGEIVYISSQVKKALGYTPEELIGTRMAELYLEPVQREQFLARLQANGGEVRNVTTHMLAKNGATVWASTNAHYYYDDEGRVLGIEGIARDITQLKQAEEALFREQQRALVTLESIGDGVLTTDLEGRVEYINPVAERLVVEGEGALGRHYSEVLPLEDEGSGERLDDLVALSLRHDGAMVNASNGLLQRPDGAEFVLKISTGAMRDMDGKVIGAVMVLHDITETMEMTRQLNYQASHDMLTGLANRREFERRLEMAIRSAHEYGWEHALFFMDLDQFKVVNDTCGHRAGDELLKQLAMQLHSAMRDSDTLARLGGDEFALLLERCSLATAQELADKLRQMIKDYRFVWENKSFEIGVSVGVVPIGKQTRGIEPLLSAADAACYFAKEQGRNRVFVYYDKDGATVKQHGEMSWVHRITEAFEEERFCLDAQLIAPLNGQEEQPHYEVLLRMVDQEGIVVPPMAFIPAAERFNLMPTIDRWVIRTTLGKLREAQGAGSQPPVTCSVNLSGQSLGDDHFLQFIVDQFEDTGLEPSQICFEITETAAITNLTRAMKLIGELKRRGCRFSLDDFGSGISSFGYLKNLPVDYLKIDGAFVKDIIEDDVDEAMVEAIHKVGSVMELKTIAEFVENDAIVERLRVIGIDYAQGYGIARPEPLDDVLRRHSDI